MSKRCSLQGCSYATDSGTGLAAHQRAHLIRGEARTGENGLEPTGVPIITEQYARKQRMEAIARGEIVAEITQQQRTPTQPKQPKTRALAKAEPPAQVVISEPSAIDLSKYTPQQIAQLQEQLNGHPHSCTQSRAVDRMKEAIVLTSVAEMLDDVPADQVLMMLSQMRRMPTMPRR